VRRFACRRFVGVETIHDAGEDVFRRPVALVKKVSEHAVALWNIRRVEWPASGIPVFLTVEILNKTPDGPMSRVGLLLGFLILWLRLFSCESERLRRSGRMFFLVCVVCVVSFLYYVATFLPGL
jgi:hypothetical protein